jgi:hypothetical protein
MKQTAVEWLEYQIICQQNIYIGMAKKNKSLKKQVDAILTATTLLKMKCKKAKEMQNKQQGYSEEEVLNLLTHFAVEIQRQNKRGQYPIEIKGWFERNKDKFKNK